MKRSGKQKKLQGLPNTIARMYFLAETINCGKQIMINQLICNRVEERSYMLLNKLYDEYSRIKTN